MKRIGLLFAGQGAQTPGMGKDLHDAYPEAAKIFQHADEIAGRSISDLCFNANIDELTSCANCQPAIYAMSMACFAALSARYDFTPAICGGLSLGEYGALTTSGVYTFDQAFQIVSKRGEYMDEACRSSNGAMFAIMKAELSFVDEICRKHDIDIANYNSPGQLIISGPESQTELAAQEISAAGYISKRLTVAGAYHSRLMKPASEKLAEFILEFPALQPNIPVVQNVTGKIVNNPAEITGNLINQVSGSVLWEDCVQQIMAKCDVAIELGPGKVLAGLLKRINRDFPVYNVNDCASLDLTVNILNS